MPMPDNEMKAGIFPGKVIIVADGKLVTDAGPSGGTTRSSEEVP